MNNKINIYGGGLSGLTAAINLAKVGYDVTVYEKERRIGGLEQSTPSVHMTPLHLQKIEEYIGIDIEPSFSKLDYFKVHMYSKLVTFNPEHLYVTERGPNKTSLDYYLYTIALEEGVNFEFSHPLTAKTISTLPNNSIIATGGSSSLWNQLGLRHVPYVHFDSHKKIQQKDNYCLAFFDTYLVGYGYIATKEGLASVSVGFLVSQPHDECLNKFKKRLQEENFEFDTWYLINNNFPEKILLYKKIHGKTLILAGVLGGFIDPFLGFGVNSALISGKIAALTVISKEKGMKEFRRFTTNLARMYLLSRIYDFLPYRRILIQRFFVGTNRGFTIFKNNMKNIPGFTHKDSFEILTIE